MTRMMLVVAILALPFARTAAAGDVAASASAGTLKLKGSVSADLLVITQPVAHTLTVTPRTGTTVNGSAAPAPFPMADGISAAPPPGGAATRSAGGDSPGRA